MGKRSLIVLSFDGLAIAPLGPYGCSWLDTPAFNRLAAQGVVFDRCIAASIDPQQILREAVLGDEATPQPSTTGVVQQAQSLGILTMLFTDSLVCADSESAKSFDECNVISPSEDSYQPAESLESTRFFELVAAALSRRETLGAQPHLLWIHYTGLTSHWDAPHALRDADDLMNDEEPREGSEQGESSWDDSSWNELEAARQSAIPPVQQYSTATSDPDLLLAWMTAYGAQIRTIDYVLGLILDQVSADADTCITLFSTSGFTLGENGWIGYRQGPTCSPQLQLPLIITGFSESESLHVLRPISSKRIGKTLAECLISPAPETRATDSLLIEVQPDRWCEELAELDPCVTTMASDSQHSVAYTTPRWFCTESHDHPARLYLKPDDRSDVNDVASLRPDIVTVFMNQKSGCDAQSED